MSMPIVHYVREKSQAKGSARTLLLNLTIYANNCHVQADRDEEVPRAL
jgi:hypothetical protein